MGKPVKRDQADIVFSQYIRLRDMECRRCHSAVKLNDKGLPVSHQASHFMGRKKENTRFDPLNVDCMCAACHMHLGSHPALHMQWQVETKGQHVVDQIILASNTHKKKDRAMELIYWKQKLTELRG